MKSPPPSNISEHRLARLTVWLMAVLAWCALGIASPRRRMHSITKLRGGVRNIIIIRAADLVTPRTRRPAHRAAPSGFRCRRRRGSLRSIAGAWLRRRLGARGDFVTQVKHLLGVLRAWREIAMQFAHHRRLGLSRLFSIMPTRPPAEPLSSAAALSLFATDTS